MNICQCRKQSLFIRLTIFSIATLFFIICLILNITSYSSIFSYNQQKIHQLQNNNILRSNSFIIFMNIISTLFDPTICASIIFIIYLITYRKLQIITFLLWFLLLSWLLNIMKMILHQNRPYWIPTTPDNPQVQMLSWICDTDYSSPSTHPILSIILLEFLLRFFARSNHTCWSHLWLGYILILIITILIIFSRMILGMHSINQLLFGLSIGLYSVIPYYLFIQKILTRTLLQIFNHPKHKFTNIIILLLALMLFGMQLIIALIPDYDIQLYRNVMEQYPKCAKIPLYRCFQYGSLIGTSVISLGFGMIVAFNYLSYPDHLHKLLSYSRFTIKFALKFFLMVLTTAIPLFIFLNPLWSYLILSTYQPKSAATIQWTLQNLSFFLSMLSMILIYPLIAKRYHLQTYKTPQSYAQFKHSSIILEPSIEFTMIKWKKTEPNTTKDISTLNFKLI